MAQPKNIQEAVQLLYEYDTWEPAYGESGGDKTHHFDNHAVHAAGTMLNRYAMAGGDTSAFPKTAGIQRSITPEYTQFLAKRSAQASGGKTVLDQAWSFVTSPAMLTALGGVYGVAAGGAGAAAGATQGTSASTAAHVASDAAAASSLSSGATVAFPAFNASAAGTAAAGAAAQATSASSGGASPAAGGDGSTTLGAGSDIAQTAKDVATILSPALSIVQMMQSKKITPAQPPELPQAPKLPIAGGPNTIQAQQSALMQQRRRRGRAATILTEPLGERLGS